MDEYRQTIAGRALADVLQELERSGSLDARNGDALFDLFDAAVQEEIRAARRKKKPSADSPDAGPPPAQSPLFTHDKLALHAHVESYNSFNEKWSIAATLQDRGSGDHTQHALTLDTAGLPLPPPQSARMLLKLHTPPPPRSSSQ